jgi:glucose-6-phosphate-specific signal transduction histidine kinase
MKKALVISLIIFTTGFILKFFHVHYNAIIMMVGLFLMLIFTTISIFKKNDNVNPLLAYAFTSWLLLLLFTVKYFPFANIILFVASLLTVVAIVVTLKKKLTGQKVMLALSIALSMAFYLTPTHTRYYLLNIKWNYEIDSDFITWDKYSWHLYNNQEYDESLKASNRAKQIVATSEMDEWILLVSEHNDKIKEKTWLKYR